MQRCYAQLSSRIVAPLQVGHCPRPLTAGVLCVPSRARLGRGLVSALAAKKKRAEPGQDPGVPPQRTTAADRKAPNQNESTRSAASGAKTVRSSSRATVTDSEGGGIVDVSTVSHSWLLRQKKGWLLRQVEARGLVSRNDSQKRTKQTLVNLLTGPDHHVVDMRRGRNAAVVSKPVQTLEPEGKPAGVGRTRALKRAVVASRPASKGDTVASVSSARKLGGPSGYDGTISAQSSPPPVTDSQGTGNGPDGIPAVFIRSNKVYGQTHRTNPRFLELDARCEGLNFEGLLLTTAATEPSVTKKKRGRKPKTEQGNRLL